MTAVTSSLVLSPHSASAHCQHYSGTTQRGPDRLLLRAFVTCSGTTPLPTLLPSLCSRMTSLGAASSSPAGSQPSYGTIIINTDSTREHKQRGTPPGPTMVNKHTIHSSRVEGLTELKGESFTLVPGDFNTLPCLILIATLLF